VARKWADFHVQQDSHGCLIAGVLFDAMPTVSPDINHWIVNPNLSRFVSRTTKRRPDARLHVAPERDEISNTEKSKSAQSMSKSHPRQASWRCVLYPSVLQLDLTDYASGRCGIRSSSKTMDLGRRTPGFLLGSVLEVEAVRDDSAPAFATFS
jgi:hypothetical protein